MSSTKMMEGSCAKPGMIGFVYVVEEDKLRSWSRTASEFCELFVMYFCHSNREDQNS